MSMQDLTNDELVESIIRTRSEDKRRPLFDELWQRYERLVLTMLNKVKHNLPRGHDSKATLEDTSQQVALKLWRCIDSYKGAGSFEGWLGMIVRSCVIDETRKIVRRREDFVSHYQEQQDEMAEIDTFDRLIYRSTYHTIGSVPENSDKQETKVLIHNALTMKAQKGIKEARCAKVVKWIYLEELSEGEVAKRLGKTERTVYRWIHDNLCLLRNILEHDFGISNFSQA